MKAFIAATWGQGRIPARWPRGTKTDLEEVGVKLKDYSIEMVSKAVLAVHPIVGALDEILLAYGLDAFAPHQPRDLCAHWLMGIEAQALTKAMLTLKREDNVVALPLHDGLIVARSSADRAILRLQEAYQEVAGAKPLVRVKGIGSSP
ncbi:hypothetical protein H7965_30020 [Siccirubricoccus deserti]|uniref:Uncharacterized protein n=2 Tax=Siccirubricoccus deserti TaxID=2013562 RepID=A0A9X0R4E0_9PROT|nr:hypothetical protein [Siccirubricoccus deserti]